jgi:hypothetical protein
MVSPMAKVSVKNVIGLPGLLFLLFRNGVHGHGIVSLDMGVLVGFEVLMGRFFCGIVSWVSPGA